MTFGGAQVCVFLRLHLLEHKFRSQRSQMEAAFRKLWPNTILPLPPAPDYASQQTWALNPELPGYVGHAIIGPIESIWIAQRQKTQRPFRSLALWRNADVFFIHPTMLLEGSAWNADVHDDAMNAEVDQWPIRHQASAFAGAGRVFAPRYRQAHVRIFSLGDSLSWAAAEVAYQDINEAFKHYLKHWNQGRPIVIAGHSQGRVSRTKAASGAF